MTYRKAEIRPLRDDDRPLLFGLAALDRAADERTLAVLEQETVFVADVDGVPAGYVALVREESCLKIDQLFVSPEHEAEGIGRQLLEAAEGYAISEGASRLRAVVAADDAKASEFYRRRGFVPCGTDLVELVLPEP